MSVMMLTSWCAALDEFGSYCEIAITLKTLDERYG
jgi:hypothetical protein